MSPTAAISSVYLATVGAVVAILAVAFGITWYVYGGALRSDLRSLGRRFGVRWWDAGIATLVGVGGMASVFLLGGETSGRGDFGFAFAGAVFLLGLFGVAVALGNLDEFRRARRTPTTDAVAVDSGPVEVSGEAVPADGTVRTPFEGEEALCHRWRVEEYRDYGRRSAWTTVDYGAGGVPFAVDDGTGSVLVDPDGADLRLGDERTRRVDVGEDLPERIGKFVTDRADVPSGGIDRKFVESSLAPGEAAYVLGTAETSYSGEYPDDTVIARVDGDRPLVAAGTADEVTAELRKAVVHGGGTGLVALAMGYVGMLFASGAI